MKNVGVVALAVAVAGCGERAQPAIHVRYTPAGQVVVFAGSSIDVYSADLSKTTEQIPTPDPAGGPPVTHVFSLSDDGSTAVVVHPNATHNIAELYQLSDGARTLIDLGPPFQDQSEDQPDDVVLSSQGDLVFVVGGVHSIPAVSGMYSTITGRNLWTAAWEITPVFSGESNQIYAIGNYGADLHGFDAQTGTMILDAKPSGALGRLGEWSEAGMLVGLTSSPQASPCSPADLCAPQISFFSTVDGSIAWQIALPADTEFTGISPLGLPAFQCSANGLCVVPLQAEPPGGGRSQLEVQVWSLDGRLVQSIRVGGIDAAIAPDGQSVAIVSGDGDVAVYRLSDGARLGLRHYSGEPS